MSMMKRIGIGAVVAIGALGAAQGASAAYTVAGGGPFTVSTTSSLVLTNTRNGAQVVCTSSNGTGSATNGSGLSGVGVASISALAFGPCGMTPGLTFSLTATGAGSTLPWSVNATGTTVGGATPATVSGVSATLTGSGCSVVITGTAPALFDNFSTTLAFVNSVAGGPTLTATAGSHCLGLINAGDNLNLNVAYELDPATLTISGAP